MCYSELPSVHAGGSSVNGASQKIRNSIARPEGGHRLGRENDGFVRIGVSMILQLDVLKAKLPRKMRPTEFWAQVRRNRCHWSLMICGDCDAGGQGRTL